MLSKESLKKRGAAVVVLVEVEVEVEVDVDVEVLVLLLLLVLVVLVLVGNMACLRANISVSIFCKATVSVSQDCIPVPGRLGPVYFISDEGVIFVEPHPQGSIDPHPGQ